MRHLTPFCLGRDQNVTLLSTASTGLHNHLSRPCDWNPLMWRSLSPGTSMAWCTTKVLPTLSTQASGFQPKGNMCRIWDCLWFCFMSFMLFSKSYPISVGLASGQPLAATVIEQSTDLLHALKWSLGYALSLPTWILIGPSLLSTCKSHIVFSRSPNCTAQHGLWGNSNYLALALYLSTSLWGWRRFFYIVWYSWWSHSLSGLADQLDQWEMELSRSRREAHQFSNLNVP